MKIDPHTALVVHRLALGTVAVTAPRAAGRLYGLDFRAHPSGAVLTRLMASRNLGLGLGLLLARPTARPLWTGVNLAVDVLDLVTVTDETRRGALSPRVAAIGLLTAAAAALLGLSAARRR
ncbi:hypothetical protein ASD11_00705 [Aeromicrobium sp. Root495]|uniref:hypothetical protein n=1 Tax=Aeromicrobium sp. Root495 TaxID=1736550 RepID=UPI0007016A00|nr:hypothetical protein [Aeromicrobium sp. Root495]KQY58225.1 hypothetical protein ASD11_00705 [Aeromicrobium sp. Root495]